MAWTCACNVVFLALVTVTAYDYLEDCMCCSVAMFFGPDNAHYMFHSDILHVLQRGPVWMAMLTAQFNLTCLCGSVTIRLVLC